MLIDRGGRVKLADFGLARAFQAKQSYTQEVSYSLAPRCLRPSPGQRAPSQHKR